MIAGIAKMKRLRSVLLPAIILGLCFILLINQLHWGKSPTSTSSLADLMRYLGIDEAAGTHELKSSRVPHVSTDTAPDSTKGEKKKSKTDQNPNSFLGDINEMDEAERSSFMGVEQKDLLGVPQKGHVYEVVTVPKAKIGNLVSTNFDTTAITPVKFRIYSHNIKNGGQRELIVGEVPWHDRVKDIAMSIKFNTVENTIITLQESYKFQVLDIMKLLNSYGGANGEKEDEGDKSWAYYGHGRIDGEDLGEFAPIIYNTREWEMLYNDTFWLNDQSPRASYQGWDAKYPRICSYVSLRHRKSQLLMNFFNTHFDHIGVQAKSGSAALIIRAMDVLQKKQSRAGNLWPTFVMGDLNSEPNEEGVKILKEWFTDAVRLTTAENRYGHTKSTVTGFEGEVLENGGQNIDYIFVPKYARGIGSASKCDDVRGSNKFPERADLTVLQYGMLHSKFNGRYMSDHRPIVADLMITKKCADTK